MEASPRLEASSGFFLSAAAALLLLPLEWCLALWTAAGAHELCHLLALKLCGSQIRAVHLRAGGAVIRAAPLPPTAAVFCSLAGPVGPLFLLLCSRCAPRLALCAAVQSAFNLLPIPGLDGGTALELLLSGLLPAALVKTICRCAGYVSAAALTCLAVYAAFALKMGFLPVFAAGVLAVSVSFGKIPCK